MDDDKLARLRRADFWTSLVFLALALLMLEGALGFPITDSYGGVQNVWYVSPALFPLLVAGALALLSVVLLVNAIRTGGAAAAIRRLREPIGRLGAGGQKLLLMGLLLVGYVYGLIPHVDYIVGTIFFLLVFIAAFHVPDAGGVRSANAVFITASLTIALGGALGLLPSPATAAAHFVDAAVLAVLIGCVAWLMLRAGGARRRLGVVVATATAMPLLLAGAFKYGLLVPLPHEGLVVGLMDSLRYAMRAALAG